MILITGANGQLGQTLRELTKADSDNYIYTDKEDLDITDKEAINAIFRKYKFTHCINCAAYTAVDKAESERTTARAINALAVRHLAEVAQENNGIFIHISSDYVYHNTINRPLRETDPTTPTGHYARTKLEGDLQALSVNPKTIILRASWVYSPYGNNFVKTMLRLGRERDSLNIVSDQIGAPTYTLDLAKAILKIIRQENELQFGVFNYSNEGICSWYDFAKAIFDIKKIDCKINPIPSSEYPTPAPRPHYSVLDKAKIKKTYTLDIPHWRDSLNHCLTLL